MKPNNLILSYPRVVLDQTEYWLILYLSIAKAHRPRRAAHPAPIQAAAQVISIPASGGAVVSLRRATSPLISPSSSSAVEEVTAGLAAGAAWLGLGTVVRVRVRVRARIRVRLRVRLRIRGQGQGQS